MAWRERDDTLHLVNGAWGAGLLACGLATGACGDLGHSCSNVGYTCNQTGITLQAPNDAWTAGSYTLALTRDGTAGQCTMQVPDPPPVSGVQGDCESGVSFTLASVESCPPRLQHYSVRRHGLHSDSRSFSDDARRPGSSDAGRSESLARRQRGDERDGCAERHYDRAKRCRLWNVHQRVRDGLGGGWVAQATLVSRRPPRHHCYKATR